MKFAFILLTSIIISSCKTNPKDNTKTEYATKSEVVVISAVAVKPANEKNIVQDKNLITISSKNDSQDKLIIANKTAIATNTSDIQKISTINTAQTILINKQSADMDSLKKYNLFLTGQIKIMKDSLDVLVKILSMDFGYDNLGHLIISNYGMERIKAYINKQ